MQFCVRDMPTESAAAVKQLPESTAVWFLDGFGHSVELVVEETCRNQLHCFLSEQKARDYIVGGDYLMKVEPAAGPAKALVHSDLVRHQILILLLMLDPRYGVLALPLVRHHPPRLQARKHPPGLRSPGQSLASLATAATLTSLHLGLLCAVHCSTHPGNSGAAGT